MKWICTIFFITCSVGAVEKQCYGEPNVCYFDQACLKFLDRTQQELVYRQDNGLKDHKYHYLLGKFDAYTELLVTHQSMMECINE